MPMRPAPRRSPSPLDDTVADHGVIGSPGHHATGKGITRHVCGRELRGGTGGDGVGGRRHNDGRDGFRYSGCPVVAPRRLGQHSGGEADGARDGDLILRATCMISRRHGSVLSVNASAGLVVGRASYGGVGAAAGPASGHRPGR